MRKNKSKTIFILFALFLITASFFFQSSIRSPDYPPLNKTAYSSSMLIPQTTVSIVKSEQSAVENIQYSEIEAMVREAVKTAGGLESIVQDGHTVILKPNLISDYDMTNISKTLPAEVNGMTTDYRITQAAVNVVRELNPNGRIIILEGVANGTTAGNMATLNYTADHIKNVDDFIHLEDRSGGWREWNSPLLAQVTLPPGSGYYADYKKPNNSPEFYLNKIYYEADVLISLPVLKNHSQTNITGAVKNVGIGSSPQNIYGGRPGDNHRFVNSTIDHTPFYLHRFIHDYYLCKPIDFVIMDGLQGSSDGPVGIGGANLNDVQENMRAVLAGRDAVAVDAAACLVMGYDPAKIGHLALLHNDSAGCADPALIRIAGTRVDQIKKKFDNANRSDINAWYSDYTAPDFEINNYQKLNGKFKLNISGDEEIIKVEVMINGHYLPQSAAADFDNMEFDIPDSLNQFSVFTVYVYDQYLNAAEKEVNIVSITDKNKSGFLRDFGIINNYPNPFNSGTKIRFKVSSGRDVKINIIDINGRHIKTLVDQRFFGAGAGSVHWNGMDSSGRPAASGVYLCTLQSGNEFDVRRIVLLK